MLSLPRSRIKKWRTLRSGFALKNKWARVRRDEVVIADGTRVDYYYWEGGHFAQVFALTDDREVVLVRQYKHGVRQVVLELPAGNIGEAESPIEAARRELAEETGYASKRWIALGKLNVSSAKSTTKAFPFLARNAKVMNGQRLDRTERIEVVLVPLAKLADLIGSGQIRDSNSIAACFLALDVLPKST